MGRNIWQSGNPVAMIRAVRSIVHGNSNVDQAFKLYQTLRNERPNQNKQQKSNQPNQNKQQVNKK
jgi:putative autoinducer-2 (AI-2) aldolase